MSLPLIYPPFIRNGNMFVDGGLLNNLPVDHMKNLIGKEAFTISIMFSSNDAQNKIYNFPSIISFTTAFLARYKLAYKDLVYPPLIETFINSLLAGSSAKTIINAKMSNLLIQPPLSEYSMLNLKAEKMPEIIEIGYKVTIMMLNNLSDADKNKLRN